MNEQTTKLIEQLAAKLGTTAEHLWGVLLKQAPISGVTHVITWGLAVAFFLYVSRRIRGMDQEWRWLGYLAWSLGVMLFLPMFYNDSQLILAAFINPEFWALKEVLNSIK